MRNSQGEIVKVLDRAGEFIKEHAAELGSMPPLERFEAVRKDLLEEGAAQHGSAKASLAGTQTKQELRERLITEHMVPISNVVMSGLTDVPVKKMEKFKAPPRVASDVALLHAANAMAAAADEYWEALRGEGLGPDFIDQLRAATERWHTAILARDNQRFRRKSATGTIAQRVQRAKKVLRVLDGIVVRRFSSRPEVIAEWRSRVRVPRKPGVPKATERKPASGQTQPAGGNLKIA